MDREQFDLLQLTHGDLQRLDMPLKIMMMRTSQLTYSLMLPTKCLCFTINQSLPGQRTIMSHPIDAIDTVTMTETETTMCTVCVCNQSWDSDCNVQQHSENKH